MVILPKGRDKAWKRLLPFFRSITAAMLLSAALFGTPLAGAQQKQTLRRRQPAPAIYTPAAGSKERKAILDALRQDLHDKHRLKMIFVVRYLKAHRSSGWAFVEADPSAPKGNNQYETVSALLRRQRNRWRVVDYLSVEGDSDKALAAEYRRLRSRYPAAPAGIFPRRG